MLRKLQELCFERGANKEFCFWDRLGNFIQDIRSKFNID